MSETMVQADNLVKIYKTKDIEVVALQGLDLSVETGELMAIIGSSGSGKSTFLNMIGGLDKPSAGKLFVDGKNLFTMSEKELVDYKRSTVGFVWQNNARNLFPYLTALENIMVPMEITGRKEKRERALELLELVGLSGKRKNRLHQLSGGEQQRIAIAIALSNSPKVLLADEPTGSVDTKTSNYIFDIFRQLNKDLNQTIIIVTHDTGLSGKVSRVAAIRDGKISSERVLKEQFSQLSKEVETKWHVETVQEEYAIIDRAGRIQIPREILDKMALSDNKIKLEFTEGKIVMEKPDSTQ